MENWKLVAFGLCLCIELVLFLIKKKPIKVVDTIYQQIYKLVICCIKVVERPGNGSQKKTAVLSMVQEWLAEKHPEVDFQIYLDFASKLIEDILSTPQKKGE